jgi:Spy/CpxP family protein refolding chaperone
MIAIMSAGGRPWQGSADRKRHPEEDPMRSVAALVLCLAALPAAAQPPSPYAGLQQREIKSLSAQEIDELRRGAGMGLALAAELNGLPGPAHLLELAGDIPLTADQVVAVRAIRDRMHADAAEEGERLIRLEAELEAGFRARSIDDAELGRLTAAIAESRGRLRRIHLAAHLRTPALLAPEQVARYVELRGYAAPAAADAGHARRDHHGR